MKRLVLLASLLLPGLASCGEECEPKRVAVDSCTATFAAGTPLTFLLRESCGSACWAAGPACEVKREGERVELAVEHEGCPDRDVCTDACERREVLCSVPALEAGIYSLTINGRASGSFEVKSAGTNRCAVE